MHLFACPCRCNQLHNQSRCGTHFTPRLSEPIHLSLQLLVTRPFHPQAPVAASLALMHLAYFFAFTVWCLMTPYLQVHFSCFIIIIWQRERPNAAIVRLNLPEWYNKVNEMNWRCNSMLMGSNGDSPRSDCSRSWPPSWNTLEGHWLITEQSTIPKIGR